MEKAAKDEGATSAAWDSKTKILTFSFDESKTSADALAKKMASVGHDTEKYKAADVMVAAMAKGGIGDAYMEQGNSQNALEFYQEAADKYENEFTTPVFLMKVAWTYESTKEYQKAIDTYTKIKQTYPKSAEARGIEKYIVRAKALMTP